MEPVYASNVNPFGLGLTMTMAALLIFLPRRYAFYPIFAASFSLPLGQLVVVANLHFSMMRIIVLATWLSLLMRGELRGIKLNAIDKSVIVWVASAFCANVCLNGTVESVVNRLGFAYDALGVYFMFRFLITDAEDVSTAITAAALVVLPLAVGVIVEKFTAHNWFSILGGVPEITQMRDGRIRCQGPFSHPILAGTFAATLLPLLVGSWLHEERGRALKTVGILSVTAITLAAESGGAVTSYMLSIIALFAWPARRHMRAVRWGLVFLLIWAAVFMDAPVWYLPARVSGIVGGGGWHRSYLIGQAINYIDDWWLMGTKVTGHWMPYALAGRPDSADITNQFLAQGVSGGLITMALFTLIIVCCFKRLGSALEVLREKLLREGIMVWSMGAALFSHVMSFMGVSYFDQTIVGWNLLLAMIAFVPGVGEEAAEGSAEPVPEGDGMEPGYP